jgi:Rne/Rng family ribonuclease
MGEALGHRSEEIMSTELIINASLPETRIALMESGEIQDLLIERAQGKGIVGNIYKGRVTRVLPGMQAAFVDIGLEKAAFLYVDDVFVHNEVFEEEEEEKQQASGRKILAEVGRKSAASGENASARDEQNTQEGVDAGAVTEAKADAANEAELEAEDLREMGEAAETEGQQDDVRGEESSHEGHDHDAGDAEEDLDEDYDFDPSEDDEEDEDDEPTEMSAEGDGNGDQPSSNHPGTVSPGGDSGNQDSGNRDQSSGSPSGSHEGQQASGSSTGGEGGAGGEGQGGGREGRDGARRGRHRRGRRGGKFRRRNPAEGGAQGDNAKQAQGQQGQQGQGEDGDYPENFVNEVSDEGSSDSDRSAMVGDGQGSTIDGEGRPEGSGGGTEGRRIQPADKKGFKSQRDRERRVPSRSSRKPPRAQVNIQDLLKEGQEVLVQVAKDPIATKGARLTCHISLPGRHLVCMPTIDHVGVSRRIERDDERRRLRDIVERNRPRNLGFIVRTASGKGQAEKRITQDINYLSRLWDEIREKSANVTAPALVYEDLNSVLRAIRDWVTDDIDKIIVDSRYHYNEIQRFVSHFMPSLKQKVELYHGDIPIFDAYNISTELSRALERKVWLKSGGYIVVDQAEALVAIDVNTGRYVGKKNLEDTILKTNLEAVQEIAYQLRLRNCGGIIILDLIDMEKEENKQRVYRALEEALKRDRARPSILKISELGLIEMTRKRTRDTIVRALCESCTHCEGKGFIKSKTTVAYEILREIEREGIERDVSKILVQAHPDAIDILAIDERETLDQIERRYRKQIYLQAVTDSHIEQFEVVGDKKPGKTAGEFSEVVQSYRTHTSPERGGDRERNDRGGRGGRDRGGRDRNRDRNRDGGDRNRDRDQNREGRDQGRDEKSAQPQQDKPAPRQIQIPKRDHQQPVNIEGGANPANAGGVGGLSGPGGDDAQPNFNASSSNGAHGEAGENFGNRAPLEMNGNAAGSGGGDDFYDEEDRLAFLRAQAAQDAALAKFRNTGESPSQGQGNSRGAGGGGGGRGDNNRNRNRRGRRGGTGKFQSNRNDGRGDNRNRGPRQGAQFGPRGPQSGGGSSGGQGDSGQGGGGGGGDTGNSDSGGGNGGGDTSQPPV